MKISHHLGIYGRIIFKTLTTKISLSFQFFPIRNFIKLKVSKWYLLVVVTLFVSYIFHDSWYRYYTGRAIASTESQGEFQTLKLPQMVNISKMLHTVTFSLTVSP